MVYNPDIGDLVSIDVPQENREWGGGPKDPKTGNQLADGTVARICGFAEISWKGAQALQCNIKPGVYINRSWVKIEVNGVVIDDYVPSFMLNYVGKDPSRDFTDEDNFIRPLDPEDQEQSDKDIKAYKAYHDGCRHVTTHATHHSCWTCGGTPHVSGLTCVCGGTGNHDDEVTSLRNGYLKWSDCREMLRDLQSYFEMNKIQISQRLLDRMGHLIADT